MKRLFQSGGRWIRPFLSAVSACSLLFFPGLAHAADAVPPARGFLINMATLLGDNGRINAIAPQCRAMTGFMDGKPIIWSRDFGLVRLIPPEDYYGVGNFLSDDGHRMATFARISQESRPTEPGLVYPRHGFLWRYGKSMHAMSDHKVVDVAWYGLSADGKIALGYGQRPIPGAPPADAPFEEHARFAETPEGKAARSRGFVTHTAFWFCIENGRYRQLDELGTGGISPYYRILSRDGKKIMYKKANNAVYIVDRQSGKRRQLTFGGAIPSPASRRPMQEDSVVRAGDPASPLFRWGYWHGLGRGRLLAESELADAGPRSPMFINWSLNDFFCYIPSFDARFILAEVYLKSLDDPVLRQIMHETKSLTVLARLDANGKDTVIDDGNRLMGLDISDNGRIALYQRDLEIWIWNEDLILPGDTAPRSMPLAKYLKRYGLVLPENLEIHDAVMSPDGQCFFLEMAARGSDVYPHSQYLACINPAVEPPHWKRSNRDTAEP